MLSRYINKENILRDKADFVVRHYGVPFWFVASIYSAALGVAIFLMVIAYPTYPALSLIASFILFAGLAVFKTISIYHKRDIIMAAEFQSAIFSAAARINTVFCLIVKKDGSVVYADEAYDEIFMYFRRRGLRGINALLESGGLADEDKDRLLQAMVKDKSVSVHFDLIKCEKLSGEIEYHLEDLQQMQRDGVTVRLQMDPIDRPKGYYILRGVKAKGDDVSNTVLSDLNVGAYILKPNGEYAQVNIALAKMLGYARDDLQLHNMTTEGMIVPAEDAIQNMSKAEGEWHGNVTLYNRKGDAIEAYVRQTDSKQREGYKCGVVTLGRQQSVVKVSSKSLDASWDVFLKHSPVASAMFDEEGEVLQSNAAFREITEKSETEHSGWSFFDVLDEGNHPIVRERLHQAVSGSNELLPVDVHLLGSADASALLYVSPLHSSDKTVLVGYLINTTEQKNLELRFAHSQKMQAVGQLAGGIAHDFNNLLTAIIGFCDLLLIRHPAGDQSFADIMQIKQNSSRAANLVRQLLAFSRKQTLQPEVIDITDVLAELSNLVRRLIGENIELNVQHGRNIGLVKVDQGQLEQVIINLAVNARDAMTDGGKLTIQTSNVKVDKKNPISKDFIPPTEDEKIKNGEYVRVDVIDTGCGIPKKVLEKIFEPFFTTKEIGSGTGLGLSTVYGIINQTGGHIYVKSEEGNGTTFSIFLKSYKKEEAKQKEEEPARSAVVDLTGKGTVMLVEDEDPVRAFSAQALANKGYTVLEADCGETALEVIAEHGNTIDIIITDVVMPGMNGPSMIEEVMKTYPDVKVVFVSGYGEDAFVSTYGAKRDFNFLAKPFTLKQLAAKVKEVLSEDK